MSHYVKALSLLSAGALLGCSQFALAPSEGAPMLATNAGSAKFPKVQPVERITSPVSEVEGLFMMGRAAHGQGQMDLAQERYAKVLSLNPKHVGALNALAVIYAQSERYEQSVEYFRQALEADASAAHVHNNFGYALMLAGRLDEAQAQLDQAFALNPLSELTRKNRALLAQSKGQAPAPTFVATAVTPAVATSTAKPVPPEGPQLHAVQPHVFELRDAPASVQAQTAQPKLALAMSAQLEPKVLPRVSVVSLNGVKIEVSNGVGIRNLARRTAERLAPLGVVTARLTNQPGYKQTKTEIFYSAGQMGAAQALSAKLPMPAQVLAANDLGTRVQMRLVLGRDVDVKALANWLDGLDAPVVALNRFEGWLWS
jgi:tetratricopeptide (TPR) repeat protein